MATKDIRVQRFSVTSSRPFQEVVAAIQAAVGHPDMAEFSSSVSAAKTYAELEKIVQGAVGPSGFMQFIQFNLGEILRKRNGPNFPQNVRFVIGNPLIMSTMAQHVPDTGSYAPVSILIDERRDGVHLSYDTMTSCLAPYGNPEALKVARELDAKLQALLNAAAARASTPGAKAA
jgi:uncharacterized protein (DUF302 family)